MRRIKRSYLEWCYVSVQAATTIGATRVADERWLRLGDFCGVLVVGTLPWSTSLPAIFLVLWLAASLPVLDWKEFRDIASKPFCWLPLLFCAVAVVGMLWADVDWIARLHAANKSVKFLFLPFLVYYFQRS